MADLKDSFDLFRGDLLYGQSRDRESALVYLAANLGGTGALIRPAMDAGAWVTVDNLNIPTAPDDPVDTSVYKKAVKGNYWPNHVEPRIGLMKDAVKDEEVTQSSDFQSARYASALDGYYNAISAHKFSPLSSFDAPRDKLEAEGWKKAGESLSKDRYYLAIRRACKFGIEHVASQSSGALIHFTLNRFDTGSGWADVLNKKPINVRGREAVLITYSELRFVYKNRDRFRNKIVFYRYEGPGDNPTSFPECAAPWEDTTRQITGIVYNDLGVEETKTLSLSDFWKENYSPYNARRYKKIVANLKGHAHYQGNYRAKKTDIDNWEDLGTICVDTMPETAIDYFKKCIKALRG